MMLEPLALNSKNATEQISALKKRFGNTAFVGAGTAITVERAKAACDAGADFLLSPSTNEDVLKYCYDSGISIMPGALTPTDVSLCVRYGFNTIKLFPAGDMPMSYVKSLKGPFDGTEYVAIGGVNSENAPQFIKAGYCGIGLGTNLVPKEVLANRDFKAVSEHVARLLQSVKSAK
jgi:2-dehydro-3-deoxyphosphogluconate aldolase/(4S)-4-hydroxy-2-oxoglutarate aldolase